MINSRYIAFHPKKRGFEELSHLEVFLGGIFKLSVDSPRICVSDTEIMLRELQ